MANLNDLILSAIGGSDLNASLIQFFQDNGATASGFNDAAIQFLEGQGYTSGALNDRLYAWLGDLGYTGDLSDRWFKFWLDGGNVSTGTLSNFVVTPEAGGTTASISVNVDSDEGTVYFVVVPSGSAVPSEAQIKAGTDGSDTAATWSGSAAIIAVDTYIVGPTGLTGLTDYVAYAVHEDLTPAYSNIVSDDFTTLETVDLEAPVMALFTSSEPGLWLDMDSELSTSGQRATGDDAGLGILFDRKYPIEDAAKSSNDPSTLTWIEYAYTGSFATFSDNGGGSVSFSKAGASGIATCATPSQTALDIVAGEYYLIEADISDSTFTGTNYFAITLTSTTNQRAGSVLCRENGRVRGIVRVGTTQANAQIAIRQQFVGGATVSNVRCIKVTNTTDFVSGGNATFTIDENGVAYADFNGTTMGYYTRDAINLGGSDDLVMCIGMRRDQNAANSSIVTHGTTTALTVKAPNFSTGAEYSVTDDNDTLEAQSATTPETVVLTYIRTRAGTQTLRINGADVDTGTAGSGTLESAVLYLCETSGATENFDGGVYQLIVRNAATSAAEIDAIEAYVADKCGVTL